jgi:hypothetical protein
MHLARNTTTSPPFTTGGASGALVQQLNREHIHVISITPYNQREQPSSGPCTSRELNLSTLECSTLAHRWPRVPDSQICSTSKCLVPHRLDCPMAMSWSVTCYSNADGQNGDHLGSPAVHWDTGHCARWGPGPGAPGHMESEGRHKECRKT